VLLNSRLSRNLTVKTSGAFAVIRLLKKGSRFLVVIKYEAIKGMQTVLRYSEGCQDGPRSTAGLSWAIFVRSLRELAGCAAYLIFRRTAGCGMAEAMP
jgi:hypothetical protein